MKYVRRGAAVPPTQDYLTKSQRASLQGVLRENGDETVLVTSVRFLGVDEENGTLIVQGTTENLPELKASAQTADFAPISGWVTDGDPVFVNAAPDAPGDPEIEAGDPEVEGGNLRSGRRRRSSSKRIRKVTRRHRHRKGSRKLRS